MVSPGEDLDIDITYTGNITYAEHIVVTVNLYFDGHSDNFDDYEDYESLYFDFILPFIIYNYNFNSSNISDILEYFTSNGSRGGIQLELTSPAGTTSILLPYRSLDLLAAGYFEWPFMSLHFWGEDPRGDWRLTVRYRGRNGTVTTDGLSMTIYGTATTPASVSDIPEQCNETCATVKGCARAGSSEYCDRCGDDFVRNPETLMCIPETECPNTYTVRSGYCYDPTAPELNCFRGVDGATSIVALSLPIIALCTLVASLLSSL